MIERDSTRYDYIRGTQVMSIEYVVAVELFEVHQQQKTEKKSQGLTAKSESIHRLLKPVAGKLI